MLQYSTVEPGTLGILRGLMALPELNNFYLVGGTALALYYGHRLSVDLDLFSTADFDTDTVVQTLEQNFTGFAYNNPGKVGIFGFIDGVKVDLIRYNRHPLIGKPVEVDGLRLIGVEDIIAMKISAILKRSVKKDFWDIAVLLQHFTLEKMIECYKLKFPTQQLLISIPHALIFFEEAEETEQPVSLNGFTWETVKQIISEKVKGYLS